MGKCDIILSQYFEDDCRYADLINGFVFEGRQVVDEKDIIDRNPVITGFLGKVKGCIPIQKYRDAVRKIVFGMNFIVLGLEHPFLGGITKEDRFKAVVTIVLYYGSEPWQGARTLYDLLDLDSVPDKVKDLLNDYRIHILEVRRIQELDRYQTDLREVFGFIQKSGDKAAVKKFAFENAEKFQKLEEDAYDVISILTGSKELETMKEKYREKAGKINMCEAIRGLIEEGKAIGLSLGDQGRSQTVARNMYARGFTAEEAAGLIGISRTQIRDWYDEWQKERS
ncbi:helix-turn-helix domain-containing protein [Hungatella sp.]|uniref:helix-turn-helix domain-containing protein n=1 Tax=Hungatella sp. TaxID=2613924 RepID=UPI002A83AEE7|nr:helix-turn-helix domain-containing protein [Hungatella sp.]